MGPGVLVGVYMERSLEMLVALLGVLKAGGAYVPARSLVSGGARRLHAGGLRRCRAADAAAPWRRAAGAGRAGAVVDAGTERRQEADAESRDASRTRRTWRM